MKILATSDLHNNTELVENLAEKAEKEKVDLVLLAGDISNLGELAKGMIYPFKKRNLDVMLIPGNHDDPVEIEILTNKYNITNLHNRYYIKNEIGIVGVGGSIQGPFNVLSNTQLGNYAHNNLKKLNTKKKILLLHNHPSQTNIEKFSNIMIASNSLKKVIDQFQPDVTICGHVHEATGIEEQIGKTKIINVSKTGKIFEL